MSVKAQAGPVSATAWRVGVALSLLVGWIMILLALLTSLVVLIYTETEINSADTDRMLFILVLSLVLIATATADLLFAKDPEPFGGVRVPRNLAYLRVWGAADWIGDQVGVSRPHEIVIIADAGAWVTESARMFGFARGRRVLYLGAPLVYGLAWPELCAVLCHEFAHYARGDARFTALTYRGFAALGSTRRRIAWYLSKGSLIALAAYLPYLLARSYYRLYLKVAFPSLRRHELAADALAADAVGADTFGSALRSVGAVHLAWNAFIANRPVNHDISPGLDEPVLCEFADRLAEPGYHATLERYRRQADFTMVHDDDTHPSTETRLAALASRLDGAALAASLPMLPVDIRLDIDAALASQAGVRPGSRAAAGDLRASRKIRFQPRVAVAAAVAVCVALGAAAYGHSRVKPAPTPVPSYPSIPTPSIPVFPTLPTKLPATFCPVGVSPTQARRLGCPVFP